jgi:hypothetical protein
MQTLKISAVAMALGAFMVSSAPAQCNEIVNSTRGSVVTTVRDDVYRRVQDRVATQRDLVYNPRREALGQY